MSWAVRVMSFGVCRCDELGRGSRFLTMTNSSEPVVAEIQHPEATEVLESFDGCDVVV